MDSPQLLNPNAGEVLKAACDAALANPAFQPSEGVTHCNQSAAFIAQALGCNELGGILADADYLVMGRNASGKWKNVTRFDAAIQALSNGLAFAILPSYRIMDGRDAETGKPIWAKHGHIAVVYPLGMQWSGSLQHDVPMLANVGKTVGVMKASAAFPVASGDAYYFTWSGDAPGKANS